jgi:hypothetical protein
MRLHLISGPRNISTALMYSFAQRADTTVVDEPFYAHYLQHTGVQHPGGEEVLASQPTSFQEVINKTVFGNYKTPNIFLKNMAHHMIGVPEDFMVDCENIFLIRDPKKLIASLALVIDNPILRDTGLAESERLFRLVQSQTGKNPVVINSGELLKNPKRYLEAVCAQLNIPFDDSMLHWQAGPRPEDGVWAKHWYASVHKSTGFAPQRSEERELPKGLEALYEKALHHFEFLNQYAIKL